MLTPSAIAMFLVLDFPDLSPQNEQIDPSLNDVEQRTREHHQVYQKRGWWQMKEG